MSLGLGVACVPAISWRGQFAQEVGLYQLGDYTRNICINQRRNAYPSGYADEFRSMLVEAFERECGGR